MCIRDRYTTTPNPSVGCVLVKNGEIVGKGFHFKAGQPHAERMAVSYTHLDVYKRQIFNIGFIFPPDFKEQINRSPIIREF